MINVCIIQNNVLSLSYKKPIKKTEVMKTNEIIDLIQKHTSIVLCNSVVTKEQAENFLKGKSDGTYNCDEYKDYIEIYKMKKK
jgi:hypothetical protein